MAELKNKKLGLNIVKIIENIPPKYHLYTQMYMLELNLSLHITYIEV